MAAAPASATRAARSPQGSPRAAAKAECTSASWVAVSTESLAAEPRLTRRLSAVAIVWEPVQLFDQPSTSEETDGAAGVREPGSLPGKLHEHVQGLEPSQRVVLLMSSGWFGNAEWSW